MSAPRHRLAFPLDYPTLDEARIPIGVVQGIVGLKRFRCVSEGFANHAGTTPMNRRKDALAAAAKHALAVREVVNGEAGRQVGTVGYLRAEPGVVNVVPGRAEFPVELRDLVFVDSLRILSAPSARGMLNVVVIFLRLVIFVVPAHGRPSPRRCDAVQEVNVRWIATTLLRHRNDCQGGFLTRS